MEKKKRRRSLPRWFLKQKLWKKILFAFIVATLVPLITVQVILFYANTSSVKEKVDELMTNELVQMAERVDLTLEIYSNLVYQICSDDQILNGINGRLDQNVANDEVSKWRMFERIRQYDISADGINCVSIILKDGQQFTYDFANASTVRSIWDEYEDLRTIDPYRKAQEASGIAVTPTTWHSVSGDQQSLFHISKKIYDYNNPGNGIVGTVVMSVEGEVLDRICTIDYRHDPRQEYNVNFIIDQDGYILSYPDPSYVGKKIQEDLTVEGFVQKTGRLRNCKIAANQYTDKNLGWIFYNVYDRQYMTNNIWESLGFTFFLAGFFTLFAVFAIVLTLRPINASLQSLMQGIRKVQEGELDVKIKEDAEDEFGEIARAFNIMTGKLQQLFTESSEAAKKQREAEIRALEAQINPHFLYNTLDSINWMAIDKGEYEISRMLRDLGVILRYSVDKSNQISEVKDVADWLEKYVGLQQLRFNHTFSFELYVDEEAKEVRMHKLLLQPFVENAILHGFKEISGGGILRISILLSEDKEMLHVIIEDNGNGMSPEQIRLYNDREQILNYEDQKIGLVNCFSRMYMYYGDDARWNVSSIPQMGTVITLKIPVNKSYE